MFKVKQAGSGPISTSSTGFLDWIAKTFNFPSVPASTPWQNIYKELVAPLVTPQLVKAVETTCGAPTLAELPKMPTLAELPKMPKLAELPRPTIAELPRMTGGGSATENGPGPAIAGVLTAVVLAGGLKGFYDFISAQYG
jgi:hypothetical protein